MAREPEDFSESSEDRFLDALYRRRTIGGKVLQLTCRRMLSVHNKDGPERGIYRPVAESVGEVFLFSFREEMTATTAQTFAEQTVPHFAEDLPKFTGDRKVIGVVVSERIKKDTAQTAHALGMLVLRLKNHKLTAVTPKRA